MRLFSKAKDGGPQSPVDGYWLVEFKPLFSIVLLRFKDGGREAFHSHAFNAWSWFLRGGLVEERLDGSTYTYRRGLLPKVTPRALVHRVWSRGTSWVLSLRGPWQDEWLEVRGGRRVRLTHGRVEL